MKASMLSRVADGMFWLNRYMERTDGMLLTLSTCYILSFDKETDDCQGYKPLLKYYTNLSDEQISDFQYDTEYVLKYIICDSLNANSVKNLVVKARENARGSQDKITKELWEHINSLYHFMNSPDLPKTLETAAALNVLNKLSREFLLYSGIMQVTMPRGLGWGFSNVGKHIERCLQTINLTQAYFAPIQYNLEGNEDLMYWRRLLLSLSGYELYLKSYSNIKHNRKIVQYVIFNRDFAHSIIYTLDLISKYLDTLVKDNEMSEARSLYNQFGRLKSYVAYTDYQNLDDKELENFLETTKKQLNQFSVDFSKLFFSYT